MFFVVCPTSLFVYSSTFWGVFSPLHSGFESIKHIYFEFCESSSDAASLSIFHLWRQSYISDLISLHFRLFLPGSSSILPILYEAYVVQLKGPFIPQSITPALHWKLVSSLVFILVFWSLNCNCKISFILAWRIYTLILNKYLMDFGHLHCNANHASLWSSIKRVFFTLIQVWSLHWINIV